MLEMKATKDTPFEQHVSTLMRHDEYGNNARRDPLIRYLGHTLMKEKLTRVNFK